MSRNKRVVMLGTDLNTMGGIATVVSVYQKANLFDRFPITYVPTHCDGNGLAKVRVFLRALVRSIGLLLTCNIKLVHVHVASRASFWRKAILMAPFYCLRVPLIFHLHGAEFTVFYESECGYFRKRAVRFVLDNATRIVVLSSAWKSWMEGVTANRNVRAIFNPVVMPSESSPWNKRESCRVLFLGRLGKRKGVYDLLDAVARLSTKYPDLCLLLGGDGEHDKVRARAEELGISDCVRLLGWVSGEEKERLLRSATIYALPSYNEGLPMSVLEAMAAGLPIVSTPVGGIPEAVSNDVEGLLVEPGDVPALVACLDRLLSEEGLAEQMGAAARRKVETTFSAQAILPQVGMIYRELGIA